MQVRNRNQPPNEASALLPALPPHLRRGLSRSGRDYNEGALPLSERPVSILLSPRLCQARFGEELRPSTGSDAWRPRGRPLEPEATQRDQVQMMIERSPMDIKPKVLSIGYQATKRDIDVHMRRVARGWESERALISHLKSSALDSVLGSHTSRTYQNTGTDSFRSIRRAANTLRTHLIDDLSHAQMKAEEICRPMTEESKRRFVPKPPSRRAFNSSPRFSILEPREAILSNLGTCFPTYRMPGRSKRGADSASTCARRW